MPHQNGNDSSWVHLPKAMSQSMSSLQQNLDRDKQWQAFIDTKAILEAVTIGVASTGGEAILVQVSPGAKTSVSSGDISETDFTLVAHGEQWEKFFAADPKAPFQSFVGLQVRTHLV